MRIRMQLMSDVIFGNGESVPGGEDISVLNDVNGFPYYKGGTFKGIFREELKNYLSWTISDGTQIEGEEKRLLGASGDNIQTPDKLIFSDFTLSDYVRKEMMSEIEVEIKANQREIVLDTLTHIRTFTAISAHGIVKEGSLRQCRCVNKGLNFYSQITCLEKDEKLVEDVLSMIKWVGTMRNRGFGKVKLTVIG